MSKDPDVSGDADPARSGGPQQTLPTDGVHSDGVHSDGVHSDGGSRSTSPWLSVVTVVRNDPAALRRTIASVAEQETSLLEHLIVDGASTDGTTDIARGAAADMPWARVVSEPDTGVYNAMNKGIRLAAGHLVLFLNAGDDFTSPDEVAQVHADWRRARYDWGRYRARFVDAERRATRPLAPAEIDVAEFSRGEQERFHQGALMSRAMLVDLGGFDERYRLVADFDLMRRALAAGYRPWTSNRIITDYDASGLSMVAWRDSLREEHEVRAAGASPGARAASFALYSKRRAIIGTKRAARVTAEKVLGAGRVSALRGKDRAASALRGTDRAESAPRGTDRAASAPRGTDRAESAPRGTDRAESATGTGD